MINFTLDQIRRAEKRTAERKLDDTAKGLISQIIFGPGNFFCAELFASVIEPVVFIKSLDLDKAGIRTILWQGKPKDMQAGLSFVKTLPVWKRESKYEEMVYEEECA